MTLYESAIGILNPLFYYLNIALLNEKKCSKNTVRDLSIVVVIESCCRLFDDLSHLFRGSSLDRLIFDWLGCLMLSKEGV